MKYEAKNVDEYLALLPPDRKEAMLKVREVIRRKLPEGFEETYSYGMIGYVVPFRIYPSGYHCNPKEPLPFLSIASQKNHIALYHMGLYANPELLSWFQDEYAKRVSAKPDIGKSCIRFKSPSKIPYELLGELCSKITVEVYTHL